MKRFFQGLLGSFLGVLIAGVILLFIFFIGIGAMIAGLGDVSTKAPVKVKDNSVLVMKLNQPIVDRASDNPFENISFTGDWGNHELGLNKTLDALDEAVTDDKIKGILLDLSGLQAGTATLQEIREKIIEFKASGKWVISYAEGYTQGSYYLASAADEVYLYPEGALEWKGLSAELQFYKNLMDKLEIEAQIIRGKNNKFKSAVEPFMYDHMSDPNREQMERFIGSFWDQICSSISESRHIDIKELNRLADNLSVQTGEDAVTYKFVDKCIYRDELNALLREKLGLKENDDIQKVKFAKYAKNAGEPDDFKEAKEEFENDEAKIAVVYCLGSIESGKGDDHTIGSERISKAIRDARLDTTVKAIVMRVNSPGGSALASDVIWREVALAKKEKPVVVSMGDVAASGGYYISCAADKIYADENTITGSIGVFGILPNMKGFFENKLGINTSRVKTNAHSDMGSATRALDTMEYRTIQGGVDEIYDRFTSLVAEGRNIPQDSVDHIGQGRVWSGTDAMKIGLIDAFGGLQDAISDAADMADLKDYDIENYPKRKSPWEEILAQIDGDFEDHIMAHQLGPLYEQYSFINEVSKMKGVQMRLPFVMSIQ